MPKDPPPCDPDIFKNGTPVLMASTGDVGGCHAFEVWVVALREEVRVPVDWHYSGGRAQVLTLGDLREVTKASKAMPLPPGMQAYWFAEGEGCHRRGVTF